jgi:hypothetical protein
MVVRRSYIRRELVSYHSFIFLSFPTWNIGPRAPFVVSVFTHTIRHTVGLFWKSDQLIADLYLYRTTQHNM